MTQEQAIAKIQLDLGIPADHPKWTSQRFQFEIKQAIYEFLKDDPGNAVYDFLVTEEEVETSGTTTDDVKFMNRSVNVFNISDLTSPAVGIGFIRAITFTETENATFEPEDVEAREIKVEDWIDTIRNVYSSPNYLQRVYCVSDDKVYIYPQETIHVEKVPEVVTRGIKINVSYEKEVSTLTDIPVRFHNDIVERVKATIIEAAGGLEAAMAKRREAEMNQSMALRNTLSANMIEQTADNKEG